ncbi:hypothetical protein ACFSJW_06225 [Flavobacterium artemisiae]|uniref:Lipoprotein n=1 Tax=Flavobacterium artemisiae TaxID=2126556 RepID=A0ABW4HD78_9FLAO
MKNNFLFSFLTASFVILTSCKKENSDLTFYSCDFDKTQYNDPQFYDKWIYNKEDALKVKLTFNDSELDNRNLDSLYNQKVQYLFILGGGSIYVHADDCEAEIKNDTIFIKYDIRMTTDQVGETAESLICLEVNKRKYPNYKKMKIKYLEFN